MGLYQVKSNQVDRLNMSMGCGGTQGQVDSAITYEEILDWSTRPSSVVKCTIADVFELRSARSQRGGGSREYNQSLRGNKVQGCKVLDLYQRSGIHPTDIDDVPFC